MGGIGLGGKIFDHAEKVGISGHHGGGVLPQFSLQGRKIGAALGVIGDFHQFHIEIAAIGRHGFPVFGMQGGGEQNLLAAGGPRRHQDRFGAGRGAIVHGGIGHVHPGQLTDQGLVFENGLQGSLADFRLVGGIGRVEFAAGNQMIDHRWDKMIIGPGPQEAGVSARRRILLRNPPQLPHKFGFGQRRAKIERALQPHGLGHARKKIIEGIDPDGLQHLPDILIGMGYIAHRLPPGTGLVQTGRSPLLDSVAAASSPAALLGG